MAKEVLNTEAYGCRLVLPSPCIGITSIQGVYLTHTSHIRADQHKVGWFQSELFGACWKKNNSLIFTQLQVILSYYGFKKTNIMQLQFYCWILLPSSGNLCYSSTITRLSKVSTSNDRAKALHNHRGGDMFQGSTKAVLIVFVYLLLTSCNASLYIRWQFHRSKVKLVLKTLCRVTNINSKKQ